MRGRVVGDWIGCKIRIDWGMQASRELAPSAIIGYKYLRMERKKRDTRFGRERRDAWFGGERRDARCWRFGVVRGFSRPGSLVAMVVFPVFIHIFIHVLYLTCLHLLTRLT